MAISKIGSLFAENVDAVSGRQQNQNRSASTTTQATDNRSSEAVVISSSLGSNPDVDESAQAERVTRLKEDVSRGTYSVASKDIALAVFRDLA